MSQKESLIFLITVASYLKRGIIPNISCNNVEIVRRMFDYFSMKIEYRDFLIKKFYEDNETNLILYNLSSEEILKLPHRVRGMAEYFCLKNGKSGRCLYFFIGPYKKPVQSIKNI